MNLKQLKESINIVDYLAAISIYPAKTNNGEEIYKSPFRDEKTPSFFVHPPDKWFDFGETENVGGDLIKLVMKLQNFKSYFEVQQHLNEVMNKKDFFSFSQSNKIESNEPQIEIKKIKTLENKALLSYGNSRGVSDKILRKYCEEVYYKTKGNEKIYFGICFKNDLGGFEIRNKYFKGCHSPKGITFFNRGFERLVIFEGSFDFLSYQKKLENDNEDFSVNFLILNSITNYSKSLEIVKQHTLLLLFLDNDKSGKELTDKYKALSIPLFDYSILYANENLKDYNEYWIQEYQERKIVLN